MRLIGHRHLGEVKSVTLIELYDEFSRQYSLPVGWRTEVQSICTRCGEPFKVKYRGKYIGSDFNGATVRQKRFQL